MRVLSANAPPKPRLGGRSAANTGTPRRRSTARRLPAMSPRRLVSCILSSLHISRSDAEPSRRRCPSVSRTSCSRSTAAREHPLAADPDLHLGSDTSDCSGEDDAAHHRCEPQHPAPDGLVGDVEPTLDDEIPGRLARCTTSATSADDGGDDGEIGGRTYGTQSRNSVLTARLNQFGEKKCG